MDIKSLLNSEPAPAGHLKQQIFKPALANAQPTQKDTAEPPRSLIVRFKHTFPVPNLDTQSAAQNTTEATHLLRLKTPTTAQDSKSQVTQQNTPKPPPSLIVRFKHPFQVPNLDTQSTTQNTTEVKHVLQFKAPTTAQDCKAQVTQQDTIAPTTPTKFVHFEAQSSSPVAATPPASDSVVPKLSTPIHVKRHLKAPAIRNAPKTRISKQKGPKPKPGTKENPHPSEVKVVNGWTCFTRIKAGIEDAVEEGEQDSGQHSEIANDAEAMEGVEYATE